MREQNGRPAPPQNITEIQPRKIAASYWYSPARCKPRSRCKGLDVSAFSRYGDATRNRRPWVIRSAQDNGAATHCA